MLVYPPGDRGPLCPKSSKIMAKAMSVLKGSFSWRKKGLRALSLHDTGEGLLQQLQLFAGFVTCEV